MVNCTLSLRNFTKPFSHAHRYSYPPNPIKNQYLLIQLRLHVLSPLSRPAIHATSQSASSAPLYSLPNSRFEITKFIYGNLMNVQGGGRRSWPLDTPALLRAHTHTYPSICTLFDTCTCLEHSQRRRRQRRRPLPQFNTSLSSERARAAKKRISLSLSLSLYTCYKLNSYAGAHGQWDTLWSTRGITKWERTFRRERRNSHRLW